MICRKVRENLVSYLAGECPPFERQLIEQHLAGCARCAAEKAFLEQLDGMLDTWNNESAPPGITGEIMSVVQSMENTGGRNAFAGKTRAGSSSLAGLLRDLVAAAAVTLVLFGVGGGLLSPGNFDAVGENVNGVARSYSQVATAAVEKVVSVTGDYTETINDKEWGLK